MHRDYELNSVDYQHHKVLQGGRLRLPSRPKEGRLELLASDQSFGNDGAVNEDDRDPEVVEPVHFVISVDVGEHGVDAEVFEQA